MGLSVDEDGLRTAADGYVEYGKEFKTTVASGVRGAALPWTAFPLVNMGFEQAYSQAYEALDLATRALGDVLTTIGLALTRVANGAHGQARRVFAVAVTAFRRSGSARTSMATIR